MSFSAGFAAGFYTDGLTGTSAGTTTLVPDPYPVAIAGHPYLLDDKQFGLFKHETIPTLRPYFITADTLGEKNINPESLWRASQNTWHKGAGQRHLDRTDSDPSKFWQSKGVNVWTKWQLSLLPDTTQARASANTNLRMAVAGTYLYVTDGNTLAYTTNLTSFTTVTGTPAASAGAVCSDGNTVYIAYAGNAVYSTTRGAATAAAFATGTNTITALAYVKGRLMAGEGRSIFNITASGAMPAALFQHPNTDFTWVGFAEGTGFIYAAGYSGDKSLIYRITIQPDATALAAPTQCGQLPDGEIVRSVSSYLGFILLGTDKGVRLASPTSNGDLNVGALIATNGCRAFEGQDRFVWFGYDNYDTTSTGLGRLDLTELDSQTGAPAYASDLMTTGQGQVVDIATFLNKRVYTVAGLGFYTESANLVASGTLDSGLITYDLPDDKIALYLNVKHLTPLVGAHTAYLSADGGTFVAVGTHDSATTVAEEPFTIGELRAETFEVRQQLNRGTDTTTGPTITRHTLEANPAVDSGTFITVPVLLVEEEDTGNTRDPAGELAFLKALRAASNRSTYQQAAQSYAITVEDVQFLPSHLTRDRSAYNGTAVVKMKTV